MLRRAGGSAACGTKLGRVWGRVCRSWPRGLRVGYGVWRVCGVIGRRRLVAAALVEVGTGEIATCLFRFLGWGWIYSLRLFGLLSLPIQSCAVQYARLLRSGPERSRLVLFCCFSIFELYRRLSRTSSRLVFCGSWCDDSGLVPRF